MLKFEEKMEPDTILQDPNHLANVCVSVILWYSDIHPYLFTFNNAVSVVPHIPVGTLCTDHFEKVTASTAPKL